MFLGFSLLGDTLILLFLWLSKVTLSFYLGNYPFLLDILWIWVFKYSLNILRISLVFLCTVPLFISILLIYGFILSFSSAKDFATLSFWKKLSFFIDYLYCYSSYLLFHCYEQVWPKQFYNAFNWVAAYNFKGWVHGHHDGECGRHGASVLVTASTWSESCRQR